MFDQVPVGLYREDHLCDTGDKQGIDNPRDKREQQKNDDCRLDLFSDYGR
jgi:hypothetical protein